MAIVTGGGRGIGRGIALRLAREGASVVVATRTLSRGQEVAAAIRADGGDAIAVACDVAQRADVQAMVGAVLERYGTVHVLVNNAQSMTDGARSNIRRGIEEFPDAWLDEALQTGLYGTWYCSQAVFGAMRSQSYGKIINFGSCNGVYGQPGTLGYNCAKEAIRAFTKTAAREWGPYGIRVNVICPALESDATADARAQNPEAIAAMGLPPLGYLGDPERDGGALATYLASADGDYMTGNTLFLEGGWHFLP